MRVALSIVICIVMLPFCCAALRGQGSYYDVPKHEVMDCVAGFVNNREKFKSYGCRMSGRQQRISLSSHSFYSWDASVFEDTPNKLRRSDLSTLKNGIKDDATEWIDENPSWSTFSSKGKTRAFANGVEFSPDRLEAVKRDHAVPDPWMAAISEMSLLELGKAGESNYWIKVFDEPSLLWAETNDDFIRGEWRFGTGEGECRVQVYFSINLDKLPVLVRYVLPRDWKSRFAKKGKVVSENEIVWKKFREGYVPVEIRNQREDFWASKPGTKSTEHGDMQMRWDTKLCDDEEFIDQRVFTPQAMSFEQIRSSFEAAQKR